VTILVASVIPAEPSPCANSNVTQNEKNRVNMDFNELIFAIMNLLLCFPIEIQESGFTSFFESLLGMWQSHADGIGFTRNLFPSYFQNLVTT
jgi:hypothetical protein